MTTAYKPLAGANAEITSLTTSSQRVALPRDGRVKRWLVRVDGVNAHIRTGVVTDDAGTSDLLLADGESIVIGKEDRGHGYLCAIAESGSGGTVTISPVIEVR